MFTRGVQAECQVAKQENSNHSELVIDASNTKQLKIYCKQWTTQALFEINVEGDKKG